MTWVEVLVLLSGTGIVGGLIRRRTRTGRIIMWVSLAMLAGLLATFGRELVSDLI
jgi:hypothetical protein